ncbi:MAG: gliding motility-associated-like protein [Crocinitomicaceae bacterium]|jgi:gliding motility-associated-like protein
MYCRLILLSLFTCFLQFQSNAQLFPNGDFELGTLLLCDCATGYTCGNDAGRVIDGNHPVFVVGNQGCIGASNYANILGAHSGTGYMYFYAGGDNILTPTYLFAGGEIVDLCVWYCGPQGAGASGQNTANSHFSFGVDGAQVGPDVLVPVNTVWTQYCFQVVMTPGNHSFSILSGGAAQYSIWFDDFEVVDNTIPCVPPAVIASNSGPVCTGDPFTLNETGGDASSWVWSTTGAGIISNTTLQSPTVTGAADGDVFSVTITDALGCNSTITTTITMMAPPVVSSILTHPNCNASDGAIDVSVVGGSGNFSYAWNTPDITQDISGQPAGAYSVTVTDLTSNCVVVQNDVLVSLNAPIIDLVNVVDPSCLGGDGSITVTASGGIGVLIYSADNGVSFLPSNVFTNLSSGNYSLIVQDVNGCLSAMTPAVLIDPPGVTLTALETAASCFGICDGGVQINQTTGTAPFIYSWNFGAAGNQSGLAANLCHGTYSVDVLDDAGCTENIVFVIDQPAKMVLTNFALTNAGCSDGACDGTLDVQASATLSYEFDGVVNGTGSFAGLCSGSFTLILTNPEGCTVSEPITIADEVPPVANFGALPGEMSLPDHATSLFNNSTNATHYLWTITSPNFQYTTTDEDFVIDFPYEGANYEVCLTAMNATSCEDTLCDNIEVRDEFTLWVPNSFTPDADEFNNSFKPVVSDVDAQSYDLFIFNRWGEVIFESHDPEIGWDGTYHGELVISGIYVWKITLKSKHTDELRVFNGFVNMMR